MYLDVIANYNKCPFSLFVCLQMADMNYLSFTEIELRAKMHLSPYRIKQMKPSHFFISQRLPTAPNPECPVYITLEVFIKINLSLNSFVTLSIYLQLKLR